jgi:UDP-N-acetylmuramate--alanine ligase
VSDPLAPGSRVHVVGCAGAGMGALVRLLVDRGCVVSGCDRGNEHELAALARIGAEVYRGHAATHLEGVDVVTASAAVDDGLGELAAARRRGIAVLRRPAVLRALGESAEVVAVAGTHGKTTTTSMAARVWDAAGLSPSWLVGTPVPGLGPSGRWRSREVLLEADESYGAFAELSPRRVALLNVEADHLDHYGDLGAVHAAFAGLLERAEEDPVVFVDDPGAERALALSRRRALSVGRDARARVRVRGERLDAGGSHFTLAGPGGELDVSLRVPGAHNVANAAVAAALAMSRGVPSAAIAEGLARHEGAPRRFQVIGRLRGTQIVDDYAHLPGEVAATVAAARTLGHDRIAAVFQPHRVSRTRALASSFAGAFVDVEDLVVTDIYRSGEPNPDHVTGEVVAEAVARGPGAPTVTYVGSLAAAADHVAPLLGVVDCVLLLGAGDVGSVADELARRVHR